MRSNDVLMWLAIFLLTVSNVISCLDIKDLSKFTGMNTDDVRMLRSNVGQMASCMKWPEYTNNAYCPNPNWVPKP